MKNRLRWDNLTWTEIKAAAQTAPIVLIPTGSVEQHGPHLPVGTDYLLAQYMSEKIAQALAEQGVPVLVAPTIMAANSVHHMSFPGTITQQPDTFVRLLTEQCRCIAAHGFKKLMIINGHGGNKAPISVAQVSINSELGFPLYSMGYWAGGGDIQRQVLESQKGMIHACEAETSMMLAAWPDLVEDCYKETRGNPGAATEAEGSGAVSTFRRMEETTDNGVMGNSYLATREKGEKMIEAMVKGAVEILAKDDLWK